MSFWRSSFLREVSNVEQTALIVSYLGLSMFFFQNESSPAVTISHFETATAGEKLPATLDRA